MWTSSIAISNSDKIYVSDEYLNKITIMTTEGKFISSFGQFGKGDGEFDGPNGLVFDNENNLYVVDHRNVRNQVFDEEEAQSVHKSNLKKGYEGSIVRTNDTYQCKRSHNLRKFKDFHDAEATLLAWVEGKGKRKGTVGKFIAVDAEGNEFGMPVMDKFKYLQDN